MSQENDELTLEKFENDALEKFTEVITDQFFCFIENDKKLFPKYQRVIGRTNSIDETNIRLGMAVKEWFNLDNGDRNYEPKSKLIRSYTKHVKKEF